MPPKHYSLSELAYKPQHCGIVSKHSGYYLYEVLRKVVKENADAGNSLNSMILGTDASRRYYVPVTSVEEINRLIK